MFSEILIIDDEFGQLDQGNPKISDEQASISLFFKLLIDGNLASYWNGDLNIFDKKFTVELASVQIIILDVFLGGVKKSDSQERIKISHMSVLRKTLEKIDSDDVQLVLNTGGDKDSRFNLDSYKEVLECEISKKFQGKILKISTLDKKGVLPEEINQQLQSQRLLRLALEKSVLLVIQLKKELRERVASKSKHDDSLTVDELIERFDNKYIKNNKDENKYLISRLRAFNRFRNHLAHQNSFKGLKNSLKDSKRDFLALKPTQNFDFNNIEEFHGFLANFIKVLDKVKLFETKK